MIATPLAVPFSLREKVPEGRMRVRDGRGATRSPGHSARADGSRPPFTRIASPHPHPNPLPGGEGAGSRGFAP